MKKILLLIQFLIISFLSVSQTPNGFNYQAVVRDGTGAPKVNQNVVFTFKIRKTNFNGDIVYEEEHNTQTNDGGLVSLIIGRGTTQSPDLSNITWSNDKYFLFQQALKQTKDRILKVYHKEGAIVY